MEVKRWGTGFHFFADMSGLNAVYRDFVPRIPFLYYYKMLEFKDDIFTVMTFLGWLQMEW